ncbi:hypothetical protein GTP44_01110 [Duganella sp. FT50W]|uniref:Uncharacterized protein n=1 Tax=Duganella lactea TaxID=2692173 RepID=A0A6L8ME81_9BURK|nr:hypothetical protein [Duganella lactea]MYM80559.1 hypothetical protein [Duganella lactea]
MKLSKQQKEDLIKELSLPWGSVNLMCDGYLVSLNVERKTAMTFRVYTYVNGLMKAAWVIGSNPAPEQKFLRQSVRPNLSPAKRSKMEKALGKRHVSKDPYFSGSYTIYLPDWSTGKAAINHLCKVCESITIPSKAEAQAIIEAGAAAAKQSKESKHESEEQRAAA